MGAHEIRYMYEHQLLPKWFFEGSEQFVTIFLHDKNVLFKIIQKIFDDEGLQNPYKEEEFAIEAAKVTEDVLMLKLVFPEPEKEPLCYCSYIFFDSKFEKTSYFCVEKGSDFGQASPFVCLWTPDGTHQNFGNCSFEENGDFLKCAEIHMSKYCEKTLHTK